LTSKQNLAPELRLVTEESRGLAFQRRYGSEVANNCRHGGVAGQCHRLADRNVLARCLRHEAGSDRVRREVLGQARRRRTRLHDVTHGGRGKRLGDALATSNAPKNRARGDAASTEPCLERVGGPADERFVAVLLLAPGLIGLRPEQGETCARSPTLRTFSIVASVTSDLRLPPLDHAKRRRARSRTPRRESSQVARRASNGSFVNAAFLSCVTPRLA